MIGMVQSQGASVGVGVKKNQATPLSGDGGGLALFASLFSASSSELFASLTDIIENDGGDRDLSTLMDGGEGEELLSLLFDGDFEGFLQKHEEFTELFGEEVVQALIFSLISHLESLIENRSEWGAKLFSLEDEVEESSDVFQEESSHSDGEEFDELTELELLQGGLVANVGDNKEADTITLEPPKEMGDAISSTGKKVVDLYGDELESLDKNLALLNSVSNHSESDLTEEPNQGDDPYNTFVKLLSSAESFLRTVAMGDGGDVSDETVSQMQEALKYVNEFLGGEESAPLVEFVQNRLKKLESSKENSGVIKQEFQKEGEKEESFFALMNRIAEDSKKSNHKVMPFTKSESNASDLSKSGEKNAVTELMSFSQSFYENDNQSLETNQFSPISTIANATSKTEQILSYSSLADRLFESQITQQVSVRLSELAQAGAHEITLRLRPEHMGEVKIKLEVHGDVVSAQMNVESNQVKHILESNFNLLKDALAQSNMSLGDLDVNVGSDDGSGWESARDGQRGGKKRSAFYDEDLDVEPLLDTDSGRRYGTNSFEYIV